MRDLRDMLTEKTVKLNTTVSDWKEAVRVGGNMLVDVKACKPEYVDAMCVSRKSWVHILSSEKGWRYLTLDPKKECSKPVSVC